MATLTGCIKKAGPALRPEDRDAILAAFNAAVEGGAKAADAARAAVDAQIAEVEKVIADMGDVPALSERAAGEYSPPDGQPDARTVREPEGSDPAAGAGPAATGRPAEPGAASAAPVRGPGVPVSGRARITALGIADDIQRAGSTALVGRVASTPEQLAELAQVYRDPRYETFRVFYVAGGKIVHSTGVSARLPGQTPMVPAGMSTADYYRQFRDQMAASGADGYYILHNHPSGDPTPSDADVNVTRALWAEVPGMLAHVVINSGKYAVITPRGATEVRVKDFGPDRLLQASKPSPVLGRAINNPDALVALGKSLQKPGYITLIGTSVANNEVRVVADAPADILRRPPMFLAATVRRLMRQSGAGNMHLVGTDADVATAAVKRALNQGVLRDAIGEGSRTMAQSGLGGVTGGFGKTPGRPVAEPEASYADSDAPAFSRTPTPDTPASKPQVQRIADAISKGWANAPRIVVFSGMQDPALDEAIRAENDRQLSQGAEEGEPAGVYWQGVVYLNANALRDEAHVARTLAHEALGHAGMRGFFGSALEPLLLEVSSLNRAEVDAKAEGYGLARNLAEARRHLLNEGTKLTGDALDVAAAARLKRDRRIAAEEVLAELAERNPSNSLVQKAIAIIRKWLRENVPYFRDMRMSDAELVQTFLIPARNFVQRGRGQQQGGVPAFQRASNDGIINVQRLDVPLPDGRQWVATYSEDGNERITFHASEADARAAVEAVRGTDASREGGNRPATGAGQTAAARGADRQAQPLQPASGGLPDGRPAGLGLSPRAAAVLAKRDAEAIRTKKDLDRLRQRGVIGQDPERVGECFRYAAAASADGLGDMVIGVAQDPLGNRLWHAVVMRDGYTYDPTMRQWFAPGVYEATNFAPRLALSPAQVAEFMAANNKMAPDARNQGLGDEPMFSRTSAEALREAIPPAVQDWITDRTTSQRGFNRVWHRAVGTQLHKAKVNKDFGKVYYAVQDFMKDVSRIATLASDKAPDMLPQIDDLRDLAKLAPTLASPAAYKQRKADIKAASDALFDGTLRYKRDDDGKAVKVDAGSDELGGLVWTDAELRERGMSERAIKMYRQSRDAINQSLDNMLAADLFRQISVMAPETVAQNITAHAALLEGMRKAAASDTPGEAYKLVREAVKGRLDAIETALEGQPNQHTPDLMQRRTELRKIQTELAEKAQRIADLKAKGYAPLMRFGPYAVDVTNADGQRMFFGLYESQAAANQAARNFKGDGNQVRQSVMPQSDFEALKGISPETAMLFAEMLGVEKNEAMQTWLKNAVAEQSALKRHIRRKGIEGFDEDGGRVLAAFLMSNARAASRALHATRMADAVENVRQGDVKDEARALVEYVNNPKEEAQAIRSLLFVQYIGGSIASAIVNLTQTLVQTLPYLSQYGGAVKAGARISSAMKQAVAGKIADKELAAAVARAEKDGVIKPQEVFQLQAEASRSLGSNLYARSLLAAWGSMFQLAEQFNRRTAFIAAFNTAREQGIADPFAFAENAVDETQSVFNKGNRPTWARGAVGATLFTFKTFTIQYIEFLKRLATAGEPDSPERKQGQRAAAVALLMLVMLSGLKGIPFSEDAEDIIDSVAQALGYNWVTDAQRDRWLDSMLGETLSDIVQHGFSGVPGVPFDVSQRLGMANLLPGTGILKQSETNKQNQVLEVFGVAGSAVRDATQGQFLPVAIRNLMIGLDTYETGMYRDRRGRNVTEADALDAALKAIGLQPSVVAGAQRDIGRQIQQRALYQAVKEEITDAMAQARFNNDQDAIAKAGEALRKWNETNPEARIIILPQTVQARVRQMRLSKAERTIANTPRPLRQSTAEALQ
jgi:proteasome lid subunit RPN8/RPN11